MTAKRFTYFKSKIGFAKQGIDDNLKGYTFDFTLDNVLDCMNELAEENQELKRLVKATVEDYTDLKQSFDLIDKENEQLKQRNDRQADSLGRLYKLIEQKDWRALSDIMDDFKRCDEQLQREWGTYGDVE